MTQTPRLDGTGWLMSTMDRPGYVLAEWAASPDGLAELPLGRLFDVVRITRAAGMYAYQRLTEGTAAPLGPVMLCVPRSTVEFLVPVGTAHTWTSSWNARCASHGSSMRCPTADIVRPRQQSGRSWLLAPDGTGTLTDPGLLRDLTYAGIQSSTAPRSGLNTVDLKRG